MKLYGVFTQTLVNATARLAYVALFAIQWDAIHNLRFALNIRPSMFVFAGLGWTVLVINSSAQA